jgi:hypothetical protein
MAVFVVASKRPDGSWHEYDSLFVSATVLWRIMATIADSARYTSALRHASNHRAEIDQSAQCGCFSCFRRFQSAEIRTWIDKNQTALCPRCGLDSVIGAASGINLEDRFLRSLHLFSVGGTRAR